MKKLCLLMVVVVGLCGCAAPKMQTASGQNEVTIQAPMSRVRSELVNVLVNRGYEIKRSDEVVVEAERDAGTAAGVLFGAGSNPYAQIRARVNLIASGDTVRVIVRGFLVDGHHNESPLHPNPKTQAWVDEVKTRSEAP